MAMQLNGVPMFHDCCSASHGPLLAPALRRLRKSQHSANTATKAAAAAAQPTRLLTSDSPTRTLHPNPPVSRASLTSCS